MADGLTRRETLGVAAAAFVLTGAKRASEPSGEPSPRQVERLRDWRFHLGHASDMSRDFDFGRDQRTFAKAGASAEAASPKYDDSGWEKVQVPHDWAVALPFVEQRGEPPKDRADSMAAHGFKAIGRDYPQNSIGWYRTNIAVGQRDRDLQIWLEFDGVFRDCLVFVNGYVAGRNESGYAPFQVQIGDYLDYEGGPNVLTVRADASLGEGWFYEGAGIYRHVDLVRTGRVHVPQGGAFVTSELSISGAAVRISTEVRNSSLQPATATLRQSIVAPNGSVAATLPDRTVAIAPDDLTTVNLETAIAAPLPWSLEQRNLYRLRSEVLVGGQVVDALETRFGIRAIAFDAQRGFFLNGKPVKLLGTCNHHDHAGVGTAIADSLHRWRVAQMQSMGSNGWRSAHNPAATALLDAADEMGMLVIAEARYNNSDPESLSQLEHMVRRDRNHPSVILWSLGNEEPHQATARGGRINSEMAIHVKRLDPSRPTTFAMDGGWDTGIGRVVDVLGFNYRTDKIEAYHQRHPAQPVYGSETGSTVATRGEYANDPARHIVQAYDTEHPWWATTAEEWWTIVADRPYIAGGFVWTGFDYRGEPTPYAALPSISSQFGILDTCGFPKDDYFYYRSWWRPNEPLVHLLPHWDWPGREGRPIDVWAHGNADEIELIVNGKAAGRKAMPRNRHLQWTVPYQPGRIEAVGYSNGRPVARAMRETTGPASQVRLTADRRMARSGIGDVIILNAELTDASGRPVPTADNLLRFSASGGSIIGVGNGNPNSLEPDVATRRKAFNGYAQAILRVGNSPGLVTASVQSAGLTGSSVKVVAIPA